VAEQVVILSRDTGLASVTAGLLRNGDRLALHASVAELADLSQAGIRTVVLDSAPDARRLAYKQLRDRYRGPVIMLLDEGEAAPSLPSDSALRLLYRPFKVADLSGLLATPPPALGPLENAVISAWSRRMSGTDGPPAPRHQRAPSYRINWSRSVRRRVQTWGAVLGLAAGLLGFATLSKPGNCGAGCSNLAGASESPVPLTSHPPAPAAAAPGGTAHGTSGTTHQPAASVPLVSGIGGLIASISPITRSDTSFTPTPPPPPGVPPPPQGTPSPSPVPPTTAPATTAPPTTAPPTTAPPTTAPPTTAPPTTALPTTEPPTTAPPTTEPPTTAPPTTEPPTTAPPTTAPATTT
jgi:hypothetical protein